MTQALLRLVFPVYSLDRLHPYGKGYVLQQLLGLCFIAPEQTEYLPHHRYHLKALIGLT